MHSASDGRSQGPSGRSMVPVSSDRGWHEKPEAPHYDSKLVRSNLFAQQRSRCWPNAAAVLRSSLPPGTQGSQLLFFIYFFLLVFFHICLTHEETHESIVVINQNSALSVCDKINTQRYSNNLSHCSFSDKSSHCYSYHYHIYS